MAAKKLAKTVMVNIDGVMAMVVVPASNRVDVERLKEAAGASDVELTPEWQFKDKFPDCEVGAMRPLATSMR